MLQNSFSVMNAQVEAVVIFVDEECASCKLFSCCHSGCVVLILPAAERRAII